MGVMLLASKPITILRKLVRVLFQCSKSRQFTIYMRLHNYTEYNINLVICFHFDIFPTRCNITQFIYLWKTALHVSDGTSTHHQVHIKLYLQHLVLVKLLLLPGCNRTKTDQYNSHTTLKPVLTPQLAVTVWQVPDTVNTVVCAPDDGWRYHPKHVEQFSRNK